MSGGAPDNLALLREIGEAASTGGDLARLFDKILDSVLLAAEVESASILLPEADGCLRIRAARGLPLEVQEKTCILPHEGISGHVLASGQPVLVEDLETDHRFSPSGWGERYRTRSLLSVPIRQGPRILGVINVNNKRSGKNFTAADRDLLTAISHLAALALENAGLAARLSRLNEDRSRLVCNLSHELNTPLTSVLGYLELLLHYPEKCAGGEGGEFLARAYEEGRRMARLISRMLRLFSLEAEDGGDRQDGFSLADLVRQELAQRQEDLEERQLQVVLDVPQDLPPVDGERERISILIAELIDNAIKFGREGGSLEMTAARRQSEPPAIYLRVYNDGEPLPPGSADELFAGFVQLGDIDSGKPQGVGIGLATCWKVAESFKGKIFVEPARGQGTAIGVLLPIAQPGSAA